MTKEEAEYLARNKTERIVEIRDAIFESLPDEGDHEEVTVAGLSLFLQAALHMTDGDVAKTNKLVSAVMELAVQLNKADSSESETVH